MGEKWFVVYTRPKQELKVAQQLSAIGIKNYCPTITIEKKYSDRKKKIKTPILSSYVMVWLEEKEREKVFVCKGIVRYLFFLGKPAVIPDFEIDLMKDNLNGVYKNIKVTTLKVGETHTITEGPFSGFSGEVVQKDNMKVKLEIATLGMCITLSKRAV